MKYKCIYYRCVVRFSNFWSTPFLLTSAEWFCDHRRMMRSMIIDIHLNFFPKNYVNSYNKQ